MPDDISNMPSRPSPDALLENARREARGRLKIFLGAAPGVGKTYEMLMSGRAKLADGVDTIIGVVETHAGLGQQRRGLDLGVRHPLGAVLEESPHRVLLVAVGPRRCGERGRHYGRQRHCSYRAVDTGFL